MARFIPVFACRDTAVYFACMQQLEKKLADAAVEHTFGGWRIGYSRKEIEEVEAHAIFRGEGPSIPASCYNRPAWLRAWQQYWKLLAGKYEHADDGTWFAMLDIANFYDSIDLRRLETTVRAISGNESFAINVLFHLLTSWNRGLCQYTQSARGLPMDLVGDCSRLLANFFLASFDRKFRDRLLAKNGDYLRFADDMVVSASTRKDCEQFVFNASRDLHELGLNINAGKVKYFRKQEFEQFWGFKIMDRFERGDAEEALSLLEKARSNDQFDGRSTALKRAIKVVDREPDLIKWRQWVHIEAKEADLPLQLTSEQLLAYIRIGNNLPGALHEVVESFNEQPFTQPKAILLRALGTLKKHEVRELCTNARARIAQLNDPVLNIALKHLAN